MQRIIQAASAALLALTWCALVDAPGAGGQPAPAQRNAVAAARRAVNQTLYASSATTAAIERALDVRISQQTLAIDALHRNLAEAGERNAGLASELSTAEERLCAQLADRDRVYAEEIAVLRRATEDIVATPEGLVALERFNAGDELGALLALDRLRQAHEQALQLRNNVESASEGRDIARLALEARNRGKLDTNAVILRYQEVTRLDPGAHWDWITLSRLYGEAANLPAAGQAARHALDTAQDDRDRSVALSQQGEILYAQGDVAGARPLFEDALRLNQGRAQANPSDTQAQRDLSVGLSKIGDMQQAQGDLSGAHRSFEAMLAILRRLAADHPDYGNMQHDVTVGLERLGVVLVAQGALEAARARFEEALVIRQRLATADPAAALLQISISVSQEQIGDVLIAQGDLIGARARYEQSLIIRQRLAAADTSNFALQRAAIRISARIGDVLVALGDFTAARARFEACLGVVERLSVVDPSDAQTQRDLAVLKAKLGDVLLHQRDLVGAHMLMADSLAIRQRLADADPSNTGRQADVSAAAQRLGHVLRAQGDLTGALQKYEFSLAICQRLAAAAPRNEQAQRDVGTDLTNIAEVQELLGDFAGALRTNQAKLAIDQALADADRADAGAQQFVHEDIASIAREEQAVALTGNSSARPLDGSVRLRAGFRPNPRDVHVSAGGSIDARVLGARCVGHISSRPNLTLRYEAGAAPLFISATSESDTTMVVRAPDGSWRCDDDSAGHLNPIVHFQEPSTGRYSIWIGAFESGDAASATVLHFSSVGELEAHVKRPDSSLNAVYGATTLSPGFQPNPYTHDIRAGGSLDASTLGDPACVGFVTHGPVYRFNWTAGHSPLLIAVGSQVDTTLVIHDPQGAWVCNDDGPGTGLNPAITILSPASGRYDVWVGTWEPGELQLAILSVSELHSQQSQ